MMEINYFTEEEINKFELNIPNEFEIELLSEEMANNFNNIVAGALNSIGNQSSVPGVCPCPVVYGC